MTPKDTAGKCKLGFVYYPTITFPDGTVIELEPVDNLIPQVGVDQLAGLITGASAAINSWYVGVFAGNYVPTSSTTAADLPTNAAEATGYSETARPAWNKAYDGVSLITSSANRASFTFTADTTLYGGFLVSSAAKAGATGVLLSIARFTTPYVIPAGSVFKLGVAISLSA